jgi:pilus assembly protein Flp/PilA
MKSSSVNFTSRLELFATEDSGQDLVEYALVVALVMLGAVASLKSVRDSVETVFTAVGTALMSGF